MLTHWSISFEGGVYLGRAFIIKNLKKVGRLIEALRYVFLYSSKKYLLRNYRKISCTGELRKN